MKVMKRDLAAELHTLTSLGKQLLIGIHETIRTTKTFHMILILDGINDSVLDSYKKLYDELMTQKKGK